MIEPEEEHKEEAGIAIDWTKGEIPPPIEEGAISVEEEPSLERPRLRGKVPLQPAVIRLTFRIPGELLAWKTGWPGWKPSEEDLADIVEVYQALGIETDPRVQALILPLIMYGEKFAGYQIWKKMGSPESTKKEWVGTTEIPHRGET